jgi:hypothetical protein
MNSNDDSRFLHAFKAAFNGRQDVLALGWYSAKLSKTVFNPIYPKAVSGNAIGGH